MARKKLIAANWKMYKKPDETRDFFHEFLPLVAGHDRDEIVVCPPFTDVDAAIASARGSAADPNRPHGRQVDPGAAPPLRKFAIQEAEVRP